ncbi:MAG: amidase, partial [Pseudomonadota bacterium]
MSEPIWQWSAARTAAAVREGEVTAERVAEAHLARMAQANPRVNAVVVELADEAREAARAVDARRARGEPLDRLAGVPVNIKTNVDVRGQANSNGVPAFRDVIATEESPVVRNLREGGAVCLGLTNTPEFSMRLHTDNPLHGETLTPWNPEITCGGSSGGAGAATALGIGCIGHGNDIGGSLRWPAHCNGLATIRPTQGRVPGFNPSASAERPMMAQLFSTQGPLAREVADVRLALEVMARRDPRDPFWVPAPLEGPEVPRKAALAKIPGDVEADPRVTALLRGAADHMESAGWTVEEVEVPDIRGAWQVWADILFNEFDQLASKAMLKATSPTFHKVWEGYRGLRRELDMKGWMEAITARATWLRRWMLFLEEWPVVLAPTSVAPTFRRGEDAESETALRRIWLNDTLFIAPFNML